MKILHSLPYYSQLSEHDWQERGFTSREEALSWQNRSCGMACIKMVLDSHPEHTGIKFADLIAEMQEKGVYKEGVGCVHQGIADELNSRNMDAQRIKITDVDKLKRIIDEGNICIVSVGAGFIDGKKSGHLVPLIGYVENDGEVESVIVHNTSSYHGWQWPEKEIEIERFFEHFSGNGIRVRVYDL